MQLLTLLIALAIVFNIYAPKIKGYLGEKVVAGSLSTLSKENYRVLNDIMLRTPYGTTQIDHIVVSIYGIFVIETKTYKGWITGSEFAAQWTKNMYGKKYAFHNPLKQNYAHVKALEDKLKLSSNCFIPIVAFSGSATIKVKASKPIVYMGQLKKVIGSYNKVKFTPAQLEEIVQAIKVEDVTNEENKKLHVKEIRAKVHTNHLKVAQGICPKCGGGLVRRKGKYGEFVGCSNYPKCRYTLDK